MAVLLFSKSYVFRTLSTQFALTVGLGVIHGLILLPVLLSILGPKPFASAEPPHVAAESVEMPKRNTPEVSPELEEAQEKGSNDSFEENVDAPKAAEES